MECARRLGGRVRTQPRASPTTAPTAGSPGIAQFDGLELRAPNGESSYRNPEGNGASVFSEGPQHLVQPTIWKSHSRGILVTSFFDVRSRSLLTINGSQQVPGGALNSTLSDGRLFLDGATPIGGQGGLSRYGICKRSRWSFRRRRRRLKTYTSRR
jgi:hypothetical protein